MKLSIISLNFKKSELTIASMESLYKANKKEFESGEFEYIVVDNASGDESAKILQKEVKKYPHFSFVQNPENTGFGSGNNLGVKKAKGESLLFLNNDTVVKSGIDTMLSFFEKHQNIGILGGILKNFDGSYQSSAGNFYFLPQVFLLLLGMERFTLLGQKLATPHQVEWVKGACLMIRKDVFEKVGAFDEKIFMYTEDMELCYRVHMMHKEIWAYPEIEILHKDQGSSNRSFAIIHIYSGILYFYQKHRPKIEYIVVKLLLQMKALFLILLGKVVKNQYLVSTYEKAFTVC